MKKLIVVALAAMAMVSCMNDEIVDVKGGNAIAFNEAFVDNAVRSVDPSITYDNIENFYVWGFLNTPKGVVFADEYVYKTSTGGWDYDNKQYWMPGNEYYFQALTSNKLESERNWSVDTTNQSTDGIGVVTFDNTVNEGAEDLLYATYYTKTEDDINKQPGDVKFAFDHLLSKAVFSFKNGFATENITMVVKDIKMTAAATGTIDLAGDKTWVIDGVHTYAFGDANGAAHISKDDINAAKSDKEVLLLPADASYVYDITFTVELYAGEELAATYNESTQLTGRAFEQKTAYNLSATLSAENLGLYPITFDVTAVNGWAQEEVEVDPTTAVVSTDAELAAAIENAAVENIKIKAGNYTLAKYRAGAALIGVEDGVVINVEGKKFGVNGDVYAENVKFVWSNANYTGFQHTNVEVYKNCTIVGQPFLYGNDVTFDGCTFEQTSANAYNVWTYGAKNVKFNNCVFNSVGKAVLVYSESATLVQNVLLEGCTLNASAPADGKAAVEVDSSLVKEYTVVINTTTANGFAKGSVSGNTLYNQKKGNKATILVDGEKVAVAGHNSVEAVASDVELIAALVASNTAEPAYVTMSSDVQIDKANLSSNGYGATGITVNGGTLDGNGYTLDIHGAGGTWDSGINVTSGTIKNITVTGSFRGIFIKGGKEKVVLDNVTTTGTVYTISCDSASKQGLEAYNSKFYGWTSYAATLGTAYFEGCVFGEGSGYAFCRPYAPTTFVNCAFEAGFEMDARAAVTFENCTLGGVALTAENLATLVTSRIANATVK